MGFWLSLDWCYLGLVGFRCGFLVFFGLGIEIEIVRIVLNLDLRGIEVFGIGRGESGRWLG